MIARTSMSLAVCIFTASKTVDAKNVDPAGLQRSIDATRPGGVVLVRKGIYTIPVTIRTPITLKGEKAADCILEVTADSPALSIRSRGSVTVDSLTIRWQLATSEGRKGPACALAVKDTRATVRGCRFIAAGNFKRCPSAVDSLGFSNLTLERCRFEGFEFAVRYTGGAEGSVKDCVVLNPGHCGITVYSGSRLDVVGVLVTGSRYHGIRCTGGAVFVRDSLITGNRNRGIYLGNKSASGRISNNVIMNNGTGISAFARTDATIENNVILNSSYAGLGTRDSCSVSVRNNIFQGNTRGIVVSREVGRQQFTLGTNTFWKNETNTEDLERPGVLVLADPLFEDPENGGFSSRAREIKRRRQGLSNPAVFKSLWRTWMAISKGTQRDSVSDERAHPAGAGDAHR